MTYSIKFWRLVVIGILGFVFLMTLLQIGVVWAVGGLEPLAPVHHNDEWRPISDFYRGVEMVIVPPGCFMMGSTAEGLSEFDEVPVHEQCFDKPFLIDRYEVTNEQYGSVGKFNRDTRPRETVTWYEALAHCRQRGTRLPTGREWEYAARGPDALLYPWGNAFEIDYAVFDAGLEHRDGQETWDVGSFPEGASWVSAMDMSGNVWEWVSTAYSDDTLTSLFTYPYTADDGREDLERRDVRRSARGGSFASTYNNVRGASRLRLGLYPSSAFDHLGFRCARDME
ncbi:MAG: formylglycine-generating enzyme family protein [Chloroflexi bacterium]|nr:MAG: formylglycine-generating enzyme family protein [Chloroflexota bacterium]